MIRAKVQQRNNPFSLNDLCNDLIVQRDLIDAYIAKLQSLLKES